MQVYQRALNRTMTIYIYDYGYGYLYRGICEKENTEHAFHDGSPPKHAVYV